MYPIGSNGASQAILDARVLAGCLRSDDGVVAALERYEALRLPATAAIVQANRGLGPELPMQLVHERAPDGFDDVDDVITRAEIDEATEAYRSTAGFASRRAARRPPVARRPGRRRQPGSLKPGRRSTAAGAASIVTATGAGGAVSFDGGPPLTRTRTRLPARNRWWWGRMATR